MGFIGYVAITDGDPKLLYYGFDSGGYLCGAKNALWGDEGSAVTTVPDFSKRTNVMYMDVTEYPTMTIIPPKSVCVETCPTTTIVSGLSDASFVCEYAGFTGYASSAIDPWSTSYYASLSAADQLSSIGLRGPCYPVFVAYSPIMNRCAPSITDARITALTTSSAMTSTGKNASDVAASLASMSSETDVVQDYMEDLLKAWQIIAICGFGGGLVFSIVWMVLLRYFAGVMAWVTVVSVNLILVLVAVYCGLKAGLIEVSSISAAVDASGASVDLTGSKENATVFEYATYVMCAIVGLALLFTVLMIRRLMIAIACLKVASQAIAAMPMILFSPLIPLIMNVVFMAWAVIVAAYLYASGTIVRDTTTGSIRIAWNETLQYMSFYHLFGIFWTTQFVAGFGVMVTAGAVASFYWQRDDMPRAPIRKSMGRAIRYHLGSIALGSFIVAVVQFVRAIMEYVDKKTKKAQAGNPVVKFFMCCVKYCLWYLEKVLKYVNRNAYILVAVKGYSYCYSAVQAIKLIIVNMLRIAAVNTVGDFLTWLGKLVVTGLCALCAFFMSDLDTYTDPTKETYLSSPLLPVLVVAFIGYIEADLFLSVYEMAVDTILLSFCEDCGTNGGPHFAPPLLLSALGKSSKKKVKPFRDGD
jgi:choline transporter-like protein 2/4/5